MSLRQAPVLLRLRSATHPALCALLIFSVSACGRREKSTLPRPAEAASAQLPPAFRAAVKEAIKAVEARPADESAVRQLAMLYHANRFFSEARATYAAVAPEKLTARDHYYLADLAVSANGDLTGAAAELTKVIAMQPDYLPARLTLGEVLLKSGAFDEAARQYEAVLTQDRAQLQAAVGMSRIEIARGNTDAAVTRLEDIMANHPEATSAAAIFAGLLQQRGETDRAEAMTQWSRQKPEPIPADPWTWELLLLTFDTQRLGIKAQEYVRTGQTAEAMTLLRRIETIDPTSSVPALVRADAAMQAHRADEAVTLYRQSLEKGADPARVCPIVVELLLTAGKVDEAQSFLSPYATRLPTSVPILCARAEIAARRNDEPTAKSTLAAVLKLDPRLYRQNMELAKILWSHGDHEAALPYLRQAAEAQADEVPARALLGQYYLEKNAAAEAIAPLQAALKHAKSGTPAHAQLQTLLGTAYLQKADGEAEKDAIADAVRDYDTAATFAPKDPRPLFGKANACVRAKDLRGAADALRRLAALDPDNPTVFLSLGDVLADQGDVTAAKREWQRASKLAKPADAELRTALAQRLSGAGAVR
jgi:tetratricopeptide (TPR) repeat protein